MAPKGKAATKGQKQIASDNVETLKYYFYMIILFNTIYSTIVYFRHGNDITNSDIARFLLSSAIYSFAYFVMKKMAKASYNGSVLIDGGIDLNMESGMGEHCKDLIIFTGSIQTLSLFSSYFWWGLLLIPLVLVWKLWSNIIAPWVFAPAVQNEEQTKKEKKQKQKTVVVRR